MNTPGYGLTTSIPGLLPSRRLSGKNTFLLLSLPMALLDLLPKDLLLESEGTL